MAPQVIDRPVKAPSEQWADAPVAVGPHRRRHRLAWGVVSVVAFLLAGGVAAVWLLGSRAPTRTSPPPVPPAPPASTASIPFEVALEIAGVSTIDNAGLFGEDAAIPDRAVQTAAEEVTDVLQRYLDAAFVAPQTRFSDRALSGLLSERAYRVAHNANLTGLGVLAVSAEQVIAEPVAATADVLTSGSDVSVIVVRYDARARVVADGQRVPLLQRATLVFVPEHGSWRIDAADAHLDLTVAGGEVSS